MTGLVAELWRGGEEGSGGYTTEPTHSISAALLETYFSLRLLKLCTASTSMSTN